MQPWQLRELFDQYYELQRYSSRRAVREAEERQISSEKYRP